MCVCVCTTVQYILQFNYTDYCNALHVTKCFLKCVLVHIIFLHFTRFP